LRRITFIKRFLAAMEEPDTLILVLDEVGFGKPLRNYGYSIIGEPLVYKYGKRFSNITCTACISLKGIETLRFFYKGGTTTEYFEDYFDQLTKEMKLKYPEKHLLIILDNL
jgi:hypothetical protein